MKKLLLLLLLPCAGLFAQTRVTPDCVIPFSFTTTQATSNSTCGAPNGAPNGNGIASWILVYYSTGFSGISIVVQSAPDNAGAPGSWGTFAGTVLTNTQYPGSSGANPNTATTSAFVGLAGYYPWMRVNLTSITGTGKVTGALYGFYNSTLAKAGSGGGGGGGGPTIAGTANEITVTGAGCTNPSTATCTISLPSGGSLPGNWSTPGTFTAGSGSGTTGALDLVGATSGATSTVTVDATNTATTVKLPNDTTSGLYFVTTTSPTLNTNCIAGVGTGTQVTNAGAACGGGGGGGVTVTIGNCSGLPNSGQTAGNVYKCNDQPLTYIFTSASAATGFFNDMPITPPPVCPGSGPFSWVNQQASGTCSQSTNGPLIMSDTNSAGCCNSQLLVQTAPSTPYSYTTEIIVNFGIIGPNTNAASGHFAGLAIRESGTGKFSACTFGYNASLLQFQYQHWASPTSPNSASAQAIWEGQGRIGVKLQDNGTNHVCSFSTDGGANWNVLFSESRTAFMTSPNQNGLYQILFNSGSGTVGPVQAEFFDFTKGT
jgi:hypothetical protein